MRGYYLLWASLLPTAILTMATLALATLTLALLTRWASLLPPAHEQTTELQQVLQELAPPPAACAECLREEKAEGEGEETEEAKEAKEAEEAKEAKEAKGVAGGAEVVGRVASAEVLADAAAGGGAGAEAGCASVPAIKTDEAGEEDEAALHGRITSLFEQLLVVR